MLILVTIVEHDLPDAPIPKDPLHLATAMRFHYNGFKSGTDVLLTRNRRSIKLDIAADSLDQSHAVIHVRYAATAPDEGDEGHRDAEDCSQGPHYWRCTPRLRHIGNSSECCRQ